MDEREFKERYNNIANNANIIANSKATKKERNFSTVERHLYKVCRWTIKWTTRWTTRHYRYSSFKGWRLAAQKNQSAKGVKLLTPNQMLNRLPISLA